jgi:ammonium transporter, Amt family
MTGVLASPNMIVYVGSAGTASFAVTGLVYGNAKQLGLQALALGFIIVYDAVATFIVIKLVGLIVPLRMTDKELAIGDLELHGEVAIDMEPAAPVMELNGRHRDPLPVEVEVGQLV